MSARAIRMMARAYVDELASNHNRCHFRFWRGVHEYAAATLAGLVGRRRTGSPVTVASGGVGSYMTASTANLGVV